ncbi:MAG: substrate-binding domain-containing protein [Anaerolineae bacterium]|nr:substrate-binding domain-containing protein [Anaerolineae bacterium]
MRNRFVKFLTVAAVPAFALGLLAFAPSMHRALAQDATAEPTSEPAAAGWTTYTSDMVDGKVILPARASALPESCPPPKPKDHYTIAMSQANKAEPWRTAMNQQLEAAAKAEGYDIVFADAAQDNAKQVSDIENFLTQGVDLLVVSPNEAAPLTDEINKVWNACIPVIVLDRNITNTDYSMFIGANNVSIGTSAGQYVAKWCKDKGLSPCNVVELRGLEGAPPAKDRGDGFRAGIADNPDVKIIASQNADWLREKAVPAADAMLSANENVNVIFGHNDPMAEGAYLAAQSAGRDLSKILFVGIDGLPTADGGIESVMQGRIGVTFVYPTGGAQAIAWAKAILTQAVVPPLWVELPFSSIDPSNAQDVCNTYACPDAKMAEMTPEATAAS